MSEIEKWIEGKPVEIAAAALFLAQSAPEVSEALTETRYRENLDIELPPLPEWLFLYTQHRKIIELLSELFSSDNLQMLSEISKNPEDIQLKSDSISSLINLYNKPETLFFFKIWAPCAIYYNSTPTKLYRRARQGKISAFEKLLRLDNSIIFDRQLSKIFHQQKRKKNKQSYRKLLHAFAKQATNRTDPRRIKFLIAGLISAITEQHGCRLTEPEIRGLFDSISRDQTGMDDQDLPLSHNTFAQAIRRERKQWNKLIDPDKR